MSLRIWQPGLTWVLLLVLSASLALMGCEDSPQDKMREARGALATGNADLAEERLNEALAAEPGLFEARRLMADVHIRRKDYSKAEEALQELWQEQGLDQEGELDGTQRRYRGLINDQFNRLYRDWVESVDESEDPEVFEEVARKGLERDSRNARLNAILADFYQERAERLVERGEKIRAAEELEKIEDLRIFADVRRENRERAHNLRREAFAEDARQRFTESLQPELMESDSYDADKENIQIAIEQTVDRSLDPANDEARAQARSLASQTLVPTLARMAITLTGSQTEEIELSALSSPEINIKDENFRRGRYEMVAVFNLEGLIDMAFEYAEFERTRQDPEEEETEVEEEVAEVEEDQQQDEQDGE